MSLDSTPYTPPPVRRLTPGEKARVLGKLCQVETAALFTPEWDRVAGQLWEWRWSIGRDELPCAEVPRIGAELERWSIR